MLSPNHTYLFLDFETTGLDVLTCHPTQIGLIHLDHQGVYIGHYTSYIHLPFAYRKMSDTVSYMTNIDLSHCEDAPEVETIAGDIAHFFGPDVIIVGHNIQFDIKFLNAFFPGLERHSTLDTYNLLCALCPNAGSFALENVYTHLLSVSSVCQTITDTIQSSMQYAKSQSHDALVDCLHTAACFGRCMDKRSGLVVTYPVLATMVYRADLPWIYISQSTSDIYILPTISTPTRNTPKLQSDPDYVPLVLDGEAKYSLIDIDMPALLADISRQGGVIALSHASKIDILKNICDAHQIPYGFIKEDVLYDFDRITKRLRKPTHTLYDLLFVACYCVHHASNLSVIQIHDKDVRIVSNYLRLHSSQIPAKPASGIVFCSHGGLYHTMQSSIGNKNILSDRPITLWDSERRHITYNDYANKSHDVYGPLASIDAILYTLTTNQEIGIYDANTSMYIDQRQAMSNAYSFCTAHIHAESHIYIQRSGKNKREQSSLVTSPHFPHTAQARQACVDLYKVAKSHIYISPLYTDLLAMCDKQMRRIHDALHGLTIYEWIGGNEPYLSCKPTVSYTDFREFLDIFAGQKLAFFSSFYGYYTSITKPPHSPLTGGGDDGVRSIKQSPQIITHSNRSDYLTQSDNSIFILSHNSEKSKKMFSAIYTAQKSGQRKSHTLLVEHITGSIMKNTQKALSSQPMIMIGGYHYLLNLLGRKKHIDQLYILSIPQNMEKFIVSDLMSGFVRNCL